MDAASNRKRKRIYGEFECDYGGCKRVFSRADHLSRHKKNHNPHLRYVCSWPGCERQFARSDVRSKHFQRHSLKEATSDETEDNVGRDDMENDVDDLYHKTNGVVEDATATKDVFSTKQSPQPLLLSPSELIDCLFHDDTVRSGPNYSNDFANFPSDVSPISVLEDLFAVVPQFPSFDQRKSVNEIAYKSCVKLIPSLAQNQDFGLIQIERYLDVYWLIYHPQYPILHRPSFSHSEVSPLLLLAMITLGASLISCTGYNEAYVFNDPQKLAEEIAEPLRWLIFAHNDCKPPAKLYIIQCLLLLESFEITCSNRRLHERSFLYHGTKIQLLRRSPILGGDPLKSDLTEEPPHLWKQWVEFESMKRACLMAFYQDTINATVYGHTSILYAYQIKLHLPCDEELWELNGPSETSETVFTARTEKFLDALKSILHRKKIKTSIFGKKVLLAGLITIMFQMQQKDLQLRYLEWDSIKESWRETISFAIDLWKFEMCPDGCYSTPSLLYFSNKEKNLLPPMLRLNDTRCKFPLYHISQIYMRITHYDYIVYAGAPGRMNVQVSNTEYGQVEERIRSWANSTSGRVCVVHAYLFLFEMLLSPDNEDITFRYDPNADPFLHRKNIVASAVLVLFAYNHSMEGPESDTFREELRDYYPDKEDGYSYLKRVKYELLGKSDAGSDITGADKKEQNGGTKFHDSFKLHANRLKSVNSKNHIVGLLKIFMQSFQNCKWEIGTEYSRLFRNCIERCLGRRSITCTDMYGSI